MNTNQIKAEIEKLQPVYDEFLKQVVLAESPTENKQAIDKAGRLFIDRAKEQNFQVTVYPQEKAGNLITITMNADSPEKPLCISGHLDTVHPIGLFQQDMLKEEDGKLYGPGIADCKGGCVCGLWAMEALEKLGYKGRPIQLILQTDEEGGSKMSGKQTVRIMQALAQQSVGFLNLEPNPHSCGAVIQRKGIYRSRFTIKGISCHASVSPDGASAIAEAARKISELEKFKDKDGIVSNCGLIHGGSAINTVPGECVFEVEFRYNSADQLAVIREAVQRIAETSYIAGTSCIVEEGSCRPAMPACETNQEFLRKVNRILAEAGEEELIAYPNLAGSDAAYITEVGIPVIDSLGVQGYGAHTKEECIEISRFPVCALRIALIAATLQ